MTEEKNGIVTIPAFSKQWDKWVALAIGLLLIQGGIITFSWSGNSDFSELQMSLAKDKVDYYKAQGIPIDSSGNPVDVNSMSDAQKSVKDYYDSIINKLNEPAVDGAFYTFILGMVVISILLTARAGWLLLENILQANQHRLEKMAIYFWVIGGFLVWLFLLSIAFAYASLIWKPIDIAGILWALTAIIFGIIVLLIEQAEEKVTSEKKEIDLLSNDRTKMWIVIFFAAVLLSAYVLVVKNYSEGLLTAAGIALGVFGVIAGWIFTIGMKVNDQEGYLKQLLAEIYFLKKNSIQTGHIAFFRDAMKNPKGFPHHEMRELSVDFFNQKLGNILHSRSTLELKQKLMHANDKIKLLNFYRGQGTGSLKEMQVLWRAHCKAGRVKETIEDLETHLRVLEDIIREFGIELTRDDVVTMER